MVAEAPRLDELNTRLPPGLNLEVVPIERLALQRKNARFMEHRTFQNLVDNIRKDGRLESVPLCRKLGNGHYRVLSGNHRVMAAKEAGLTEVLIMYLDGDMTRAEEVAKVLSHNAIVGEDDVATLHALWEEIDDVALKYYTGLDDAKLGQMADVMLHSLTDADLDYQMISFIFLPHETARLEAALAKAQQVLDNDAIAVRWAEYDRLLDGLVAIKQRHRVKNGATAFMLLLDLIEGALAETEQARKDEASNGTPSGA